MLLVCRRASLSTVGVFDAALRRIPRLETILQYLQESPLKELMVSTLTLHIDDQAPRVAYPGSKPLKHRIPTS